jgi:hypothetical protein
LHPTGDLALVSPGIDALYIRGDGDEQFINGGLARMVVLLDIGGQRVVKLTHPAMKTEDQAWGLYIWNFGQTGVN